MQLFKASFTKKPKNPRKEKKMDCRNAQKKNVFFFTHTPPITPKNLREFTLNTLGMTNCHFEDLEDFKDFKDLRNDVWAAVLKAKETLSTTTVGLDRVLAQMVLNALKVKWETMLALTEHIQVCIDLTSTLTDIGTDVERYGAIIQATEQYQTSRTLLDQVLSDLENKTSVLVETKALFVDMTKCKSDTGAAGATGAAGTLPSAVSANMGIMTLEMSRCLVLERFRISPQPKESTVLDANLNANTLCESVGTLALAMKRTFNSLAALERGETDAAVALMEKRKADDTLFASAGCVEAKYNIAMKIAVDCNTRMAKADSDVERCKAVLGVHKKEEAVVIADLAVAVMDTVMRTMKRL